MFVVLTYIVPSPSPRCLLSKDSEEFKRLVEYVKNTHGATHTMCELEVMEHSRWPDTEGMSDSGFAPKPPTSVVFSHRWVDEVGGWGWIVVC